MSSGELKMFQKKFLSTVFAVIVVCFLTLSAAVADVQSVKVKARAPNNKLVEIFYRVPANYDSKAKRLYRVLVLFGGRNGSGKNIVGNGFGFGAWADQNDIFLVSPTFKDDKYWEPEKWSGKALFDGLKEIKKKYNICDKKIMYYGFSAGSQCSNLFPAWRPESCVAWVSHGCGVFHSPGRKMVNCPGLVTCGDADIMRYILTRRFVDACRKLNLNILWKSYPNLPHEVPKESSDLARVFLAYHHEQNISDLQTGLHISGGEDRKLLYVGDDQENRFWPVTDPAAKNIEREDRVEFFTRQLALAWGSEAKPRK